jgi:glycogen debranching enzyme
MSARPSLFALTGAAVLAGLSLAHGQPADDAPAHGLEVGTFCATSPYGLSILVDRGAAFLLEPDMDGFPSSRFFQGSDEGHARYGTCAPDGSYYRIDFTNGGSKIAMTWGKLNEHAVGVMLTCDHAITQHFGAVQRWSGCRTVFWKEGDGLGGVGFAGNTGQSVAFHLHTQPPITGTNAHFVSQAGVDVPIDPARPTIMVINLGNDPAPPFDSVAAALDAAGKAYAAKRIAAEGDWGNFLRPIADAMNNSRMFSSLDRRVAYSVGRGWWIFHQSPVNENPDWAPYFCWDSFFNGNLGSLEDPTMARDTIRAVLSLEDPDGMVGNYSHWPANDEYISADRSQPPVGSLNAWKVYQRWPDRAFLAEVYPKLVKWHDWWHSHRAKPGDFLLSWGSATGSDMQDARWETGWDDTHSLDGGKFEGTCVNVYAVDLCSLWAMDAENLAKIADALGKSGDAAHFRAEHDRMVKEMNTRLWNESLGLYCNRFWEDNADGSPNFLTRITPMNFYPLICGAPDAARAKRMLDYFHQPKKFWGDWPIPTLPYDDPDWAQQDYWHGHVWAPVNYLMWQGLERYDDKAHLADFAEKSVKIFMQNWNSDSTICSENYRSDNGKADDHPHYTWGALLPLLGVEALVDIGPDLKPVPRQLGLKENLTLHHVPVGGKLYRVESKGGTVSVTAE